MNTGAFYAHGKLLISGEYLVLSGALALALPSRFGQWMRITKNPERHDRFLWRSLEKGKEWFRIEACHKHWYSHDGQFSATAEKLIRLFGYIEEVKPGFRASLPGLQLVTDLEFNREWGLGSSATLVSNLAQWAGIDPYNLQWAGFGGSGYDIACARSDSPILYQYQGTESRPLVQSVKWEPSFAGNLYFAYTGRKQSTAQSLKVFDAKAVPGEYVAAVSQLSLKMLQAQKLQEFMELMKAHEELTARATGLEPLSNSPVWRDFPGAVKSLGAWGGDFLMLASALPFSELSSYISSQTYEPIFSFNEFRIN